MKFIVWCLFTTFFLCSNAIYACKQTPAQASRSALRALLSNLDLQNEREISLLKHVENKAGNWTYLVETVKDSKACEANIFTVYFEPSCKTTVHKLNSTPCL